jgi:hypothetical protein
MSIFSPDAAPVDLSPKRTPDTERYPSARVDSTRRPLSSLMPFVEGYSWSVTYYSQVLGAADPVMPLQLGADPTLQQYLKIKNFELKVTDELSFEFAKERQAEVFEGSAIIYAGNITPARHDLFIADIGRDRFMIFTIMDVTPRSALAERAFEIRYRSYEFLNDSIERELEVRVVDSAEFHKEFLIHGQNPVLRQDTVNGIRGLQSYAAQLLATFVDDFVDQESRFILIPDQEQSTYDPYLTEFLRKILNTSEHPILRKLNYPNFRNVIELNVNTVWDSLLFKPSRRIHKKMSIVSSWVLRNTPAFGGIYYSTVLRVAYPIHVEGRTLTYYPLRSGKPLEGDLESNLPDGTSIDLESHIGEGREIPDIHPVGTDDYYVFSKAFYENDQEQQSKLERLTLKMLERKTIDPVEFITLASKTENWDSLERFYYTPILIAIAQYALRGV